MDAQIYKLIASAEQEQNLEYLNEAFQILNPESQKSKNDKIKSDIENISQNLYVQCAEIAINLNEFGIATKCIQIYFNMPMISNQFLARAYLCQFQLLAPNGTNQLENLDKCIPFLFKAIEFSKQNKRYNFLVYNASVLFWKYIRAFLKHKYRRYICTSLKFILDSLNEIDDSDYEWRATLTKILIECYIDDEKKDDAIELAKSAEIFIREKVPHMYNEFFSFAVKQNLFNLNEVNELSLTKPHLYSIYKIEKLRANVNIKSITPPNEEISNEFSNLYKQILTLNKTNETQNNENEFLRQKLLLELAHICLLYNDPNISSLIIGYLKERELMNEELSLELDFIECEKLVKELKHKQEKYNKLGVKTRVDAVKRCDDLLKNTIRTNNPNLIQFGCSIQWNLCLPLLQPGLRKDVRKPLEFVAECLENIESMEWLFRCQVHFEIAKCEEEIEQLQVAEQHLVKALQLDDHKIYTDQLNHALTRLKLKAELYKTPEKLENQVAMILEQSVKVEKNSKSGGKNKNEINTRSLLLRAADLLAHNEFGHVMESETFKQGVGKMNEDIVTRLLAKSRNHVNCVSKCTPHITDHMKDLENKYQDSPKDVIENNLKIDYKERLKLWFDLCKIARKQQIWDVCRVACRFCLLYDDEKLINRFIPLNDIKSQLYHKELMRNLAEAHFVKGEALMQFIRGENIELFDKPKAPQLTPDGFDAVSSSMNKFQKIRNFETDTEWLEYSKWLQSLCDEIIKDFLRGVKIGVILNESWIVCQGAAYCWNYFHHIFEQKRHLQVNNILIELLDGLKKCGHNNESVLLVNICNALAIGLISPWLPPEPVKTLAIPGTTATADQSLSGGAGNKSPTRKTGKSTGSVLSQPALTNTKSFTVPSEALGDFKKALEACEYALNITNGENLIDVINLKDRLPLIKTWVLIKQLIQSPIKNYGLQILPTPRIQDKFTKCLVAVEILDRNTIGYLEIKDAPTIKEAISFVDQASTWPDKLIELQLWCRLAILANKSNDTESLRYSHAKALSSVSYFEKRKSENKLIYTTSQSLLSEVCIALGEHLSVTLNPGAMMIQLGTANKREMSSLTTASNKDIRSTIRREAVNAFSDGAGYAAKAENYELAIHAARQFWNLSLSYLKKPSERALLLENLREILSSLTLTFKIKKTDAEKGEDEETEGVSEKTVGILKNKDKKSRPQSPSKGESITKFQPNIETMTSISTLNKNADAFDDLTLRSALYGCLFQILIDRKDYAEALEEMDRSLNDMPRTKHRLLIYRYRIMTKAKLGLDVQMDLQKFREESEKNLAEMYRKVALSSNKHEDIISAYQRAIEALNSEENVWLKFEYLIELSQWLYTNEYKLQNSIDLIEWAIDIVSNIRTEKPQSASTSVISRLSKQTKNSKTKQITINESSVRLQAPSMSDILEVKSENGTEFDVLQSSFMSKEAPIGILPFNKNLQLNDLQDIKQLECLTRANVIIAHMIGRKSIEYNHYLIKSYCFLTRLLQQSIDNALSSMKEIQKQTAQAEQAQAVNKKQDPKSQGKNNKTQDPLTKPTGGLQQKKLKGDTTSATYLPQTIEEWSSFEINDEILSAWSHELMKKTGINVNTINEPYIFFYYLEILSNMLHQQGFTHYLFLIYNIQLILIKTAIKQKLQTPLNQQFTSLECYTRLKCINLCVELNLINSVTLHQQTMFNLLNNNQTTPTGNVQTTSPPSALLKLIQLDPLEVSYVRDEIYENNQRKTQIAKEELTNASSFLSKKSKDTFYPGKHLKRQTFANIDAKISEKQNKLKTLVDELKQPGEQRQITNSLIEILYKDTWIKIAELLVKNGFMQNARDFIYEALNTSQNFNDNYSVAKLYYLLGEISLFDANYSEAINFCLNAQKTAIDELFWFNCVSLLVRASKNDSDKKNSIEKTTAILYRALDIVEKEIHKRSNKINVLSYMRGKLIFEIAKLNYEKAVNKSIDIKSKNQSVPSVLERVNTMRPAVFKVLSQTKKMYEQSTEILLNEGYKRESLEIIKAHYELLKRFAEDCHNKDAKHDYMLQSYKVLKNGCKIANEIYFDIQTYQTFNEFNNTSLPIQRELVNMKINLSQLLTQMLDQHVNEIKEKNLNNLNKDHIVKTFEEYLQECEEISDTEKEWRSLLNRITDEIFSNLISSHNLSHKIKQLKGKIFYLIGRTIRLLNEIKLQSKATALHYETQISILPLSKWDSKIIELIKIDYQSQHHSNDHDKSSSKVSKPTIKTANASAELEQSIISSSQPPDFFHESQNVEENAEINEALTSEVVIKLNEQNYIEKMLSNINRYDTQSMEYLLQSLNVAFSIEDKELISNICYELIELTGRFDMQLCSQFIALYQSSMNAFEIENMLQKYLKDPKSSLLASYLQQIKSFKESNTTNNTLNSPVINQYINSVKNKFVALKNLSINPIHLNLNKEFPNNYILMILQLNSQKNELYGTILDRLKHGTKNNKQSSLSSIAPTKAMSIKIKTDEKDLFELQHQWKTWKNDLQSYNLKVEFHLNHELVRKEMLANLNSSGTAGAEDQYFSSNANKAQELTEIETELESRFNELIEKTEEYLKPITNYFEPFFENLIQEANNGKQQNEKPTERVILLADLSLLEFPLEALKLFHNNSAILSISRDYSLQILYNRFVQEKENVDTVVTNDAKQKGKNAPARAANTASNSNVDGVTEGSLIIDPTQFKYLIDIYNESSNTVAQEFHPINTFKTTIQQFANQTTKWQGLLGNNVTSSQGERERLLNESNGLLFYGMERFLSYYQASKIPSFNLNKCNLLILNDMSQTNKSSNRVSKLDVFKSLSDIQNEQPLNASILLSLSGIKCIATNQWSTTLSENSKKFQSMFKDLLSSPQSIGEIIRYRISPHLKLILANKAKKEEESKKIGSNEKEKENKDSKKDLKKDVKKDAKHEKHPTQAVQIDQSDNKDENELKLENEIKELEKIKKENFNMVCYGVPDVYFTN